MTRSELKKAVQEVVSAPRYDSQSYVDGYLKVHMNRFAETIFLLQGIVGQEMRVVDVGSYGSLVPALKDILGLADITATEPFQEGQPASEEIALPNTRDGHRYPYHVDRFDLEGTFPYVDGSFDLVIFTEVLEHLAVDPLHTLSEINRITKVGGWLLLSTPNCACAKSVLRILRGGNPSFFSVYTRLPSRDRHNREYVPWEVAELLRSSGYEVARFHTADVYDDGRNAKLKTLLARNILWISTVLSFGLITARDRGDTIFAVGRKTSGIQDRYPAFLYV